MKNFIVVFLCVTSFVAKAQTASGGDTSVTDSASANGVVPALGGLSKFFVDVLLWVPQQIYYLLCDGLATVIEAIPAPDFVSQTGPAFSALSGISYFLDLFAVPQGFAVIISAYTIRFLLRRIPFIG